MDLWNLPGPKSYLERLAKALRDGFNIVSAIPANGVSGLGNALRNFLGEEGWMIPGCFLANGKSNPLDQLYTMLEVPDHGLERRAISTLIASLEPGGIIIINGIKRDHWPEWKQFLATYEAVSRGVSRSNRPLLIAIVEGTPISELGRDCAALRIFAWENVVGEFDMMLFVLSFLRTETRKPGKMRFLARVIARLSLWDFELASQLATSNEKLLFEPIEVLRLTVEALPPSETLEATWEAGGVMLFDDVSLQHPYLLITDASKHEMLRRRLWEAQTSDLLPLIETKRHYWAQQLRPHIRSPIRLGEQIFEDIDDLEIGHLAFLVKKHNLKAPICRAIDTLRRYRNKLAHLEPLAYAEAFDTNVF